MKRKDVTLKISSLTKSEEVCSFILLKSSIKSSSLESLFISPFFLSSPHLFFSFFFYIPSPFHLHLPLVCQMASADTCPISTSYKSSYSSCKAETHCSGITSTLIGPGSQLQCINCGGSSFLPRYFGALSYLISLQCLSDPTEFLGLSSLLSNHLPGPRPSLAEDVFILDTLSGAITIKPHLLFISAISSDENFSSLGRSLFSAQATSLIYG